MPERDMRIAIGALLENKIYGMIGLTKLPTKENAKEIARFIYKRYPEFTLEDLYNAFEYALAEVITSGRNDPKENWLDHYQSFNIKYFNPILAAYRKFKSAAVSKIEKEIQMDAEAIDFIELRQKNSAGIKRTILLMYQYYLDNNYGMIFTTVHEYDYLDELGLIMSTPEEKRKYLDEAKGQIFAEAKVRREFQLHNWIQKQEKNIMALAKHKCVLQLFEEFSSCGVQRDILSLIMDVLTYIDPASHYRLKQLQAEHGRKVD